MEFWPLLQAICLRDHLAQLRRFIDMSPGLDIWIYDCEIRGGEKIVQEKKEEN